MLQHCCFVRMQILGNGINWKKYIHLDKAYFSFAFSLTGRVLEKISGQDWKTRAPASVFLVFFFPPFFFSPFSISSFLTKT